MLQATKNKYMETLKPLNILYDPQALADTTQDVDMANGYVELIERTRSERFRRSETDSSGQIRKIRQRPLHRETQKYGRTDFHL